MSEVTPDQGPRLGLVLGGGAALGAAHAGVVEVLQRAGYSFPVVSGTSAGGLIGAGYAAGLSSRVIVDVILTATWGDFAKFNRERRWGLLDTSPLEQSIEKHITVSRIEDLPRRFGAVAWDMRAREAVLLTEGPLGRALRSTSAVPGLFPPVLIGDQLLVDGAVADNLPVWAARLLGADLVVAVDVQRGVLKAVKRVRHTLREVRPSAGDVSNDRPAEVVIQPDTSGAPRWSAKAVPELIAAGQQAAEAALPDIAAAIAHARGLTGPPAGTA